MQLDHASTTILIDVVRWIAAGAVGVIAWILRGMVIRINKLEEKVVPREEIMQSHSKLHEKLQNKVDNDRFREYIERAEILRSETRQMINGLVDKIDALKDIIIHLSDQMRDKGRP